MSLAESAGWFAFSSQEIEYTCQVLCDGEGVWKGGSHTRGDSVIGRVKRSSYISCDLEYSGYLAGFYL